MARSRTGWHWGVAGRSKYSKWKRRGVPSFLGKLFF